ncbi:MAG: TIGR03067 domain-containing protein [Planctomycetaceae bacterium]|nr:TIGR03067 domain-containing protein [Planctomycetaceae bacterium]
MFPHRAWGPAFAVLVLSAAAQAQQAAPATVENDLPKFAGLWSVTAAELGGEAAPELVGATFSFDSSTAKFTQIGEDGKPITDVHPFKADVKTKRLVLYQQPDPMDPMRDPKAGMQKGIYKFGATALFLCLTAPDAPEFPTEFTSKPEFLMLRLEKAKPGTPARTAAAPQAPVKK